MKSPRSSLIPDPRRIITAAILSLSTLGCFTASAAPMNVRPIRGSYCAAYGPQGWFVRGENAQRVAFGADLSSGDGRAAAGFSVFTGGTLGIRGMETPERAVATSITQMGTVRTQFGRTRQLSSNTSLVEYQNSGFHGIVFYEVFPAGGGAFTIVMRTAGTTLNAWRQKAGEAAAVARSLHCNVPATPAQPDPPTLNGSRRDGQKSDESDTYYNQWLDKEYYHNPKTGENFWVSPSTDYHQTGPDGPGYYAQFGNSNIKLDPGYSR